MELSDLCNELKNWFEKERIFGEFTISDGSISLDDELQENQYFRIVGSVFNDGVYQYPTSILIDETFDGAVWAMAVPPAVIALLQDINEWEAKYSDAIMSPYSSESFGGYSYSKSVGNGATGAENGSGDYRSVFASRLNKWRKV